MRQPSHICPIVCGKQVPRKMVAKPQEFTPSTKIQKSESHYLSQRLGFKLVAYSARRKEELWSGSDVASPDL